MANIELYDGRASKFSRYLRDLPARGAESMIVDLDGFRIIGNDLRILEHRTGGRADCGRGTLQAAEVLADRLVGTPLVIVDRFGPHDVDTRQRVWFAYRRERFAVTAVYAVFAVVDNSYPPDAKAEHRRWTGKSALPAGWAKLCWTCRSVDLPARIVGVDDSGSAIGSDEDWILSLGCSRRAHADYDPKADDARLDAAPLAKPFGYEQAEITAREARRLMKWSRLTATGVGLDPGLADPGAGRYPALIRRFQDGYSFERGRHVLTFSRRDAETFANWVKNGGWPCQIPGRIFKPFKRPSVAADVLDGVR